MLADGWQHRSGNRGHPRDQGVEAVLSVVVGSMGVEGVAVDELRDGRWLRGKVNLGLRWLFIAAGVLGGFAR